MFGCVLSVSLSVFLCVSMSVCVWRCVRAFFIRKSEFPAENDVQNKGEGGLGGLCAEFAVKTSQISVEFEGFAGL